jgi:hypothetical protein
LSLDVNRNLNFGCRLCQVSRSPPKRAQAAAHSPR